MSRKPRSRNGADQSLVGKVDGDGNEISGAGSGGGGDGDAGFIDPASASGGSDNGGTGSGDTGKRRTYTKRAKAASAGVPVNLISSTLLMVHAFLGKANPVWELRQDEADLVAKPAADLLAHYGVGGGSETMQLWINAAMAFGVVYGPRMFAKKPKPQNAPAEVVTLRAEPNLGGL